MLSAASQDTLETQNYISQTFIVFHLLLLPSSGQFVRDFHSTIHNLLSKIFEMIQNYKPYYKSVFIFHAGSCSTSVRDKYSSQDMPSNVKTSQTQK